MSLFKNSSRATLRGALGSPATPQQVINTKGHIDRLLVRDAIRNAGDHKLAATSYGGGALKDHHTIQPHDVTLGLRSQVIVQRLLNHPNLKVISAFNGLNYAKYPTDNHIARAFTFTGVALDVETYDANRKDSGLALQIGGVYTILNTGSRTLKPGMLARWRPPPTNRGMPAGVPMSQLPMDNWNPGDPRDKLFPLIEPYDPRDMNAALTSAYATVFRPSSYADNESPGIKGAPYRWLYDADAGPGRNMRRATSHQDEAFGLKFGLLGAVLQGVFALIKMGLIRANGGEDAGGAIRRIVDAIGLFEENSGAKEAQLEELLAHIMWRHVPSMQVVADVSNSYTTAFSGGFIPGTSRPKESFRDIEANIARLFTDSMSNLAGCINGAAQEERANILGKVLNESMPGEGATICFGMRNQ